MDIHTAAHYLKAGYRITRADWAGLDLIYCYRPWIDKNGVVGRYFHLEDFLATDWEIDYRDLIDDSGSEPQYKAEENEEEDPYGI
jgi:hypothetical protein